MPTPGRQPAGAAGRACRDHRRRQRAPDPRGRRSRSLDRLGHGMGGGRLEIYGDVGAYLGQGMSGGRIELFGSAGVYAAAKMRGGSIHVTANAGDFLGGGAARRRGRHGGRHRPGRRRRRRPGRRPDAARADRRAWAAGRLRRQPHDRRHDPGPGAAAARTRASRMRRGALLLGRAPANLLATFADNGTHELPWLRAAGKRPGRTGAGVRAAGTARPALDRLRLGRRQGRDCSLRPDAHGGRPPSQ